MIHLYVFLKHNSFNFQGKIAGELKRVGAFQNSRIAPAPAPAPPPPRPPPELNEVLDVLRKMTANYMVVAALIATIAFIDGFTYDAWWLYSKRQ